ncbi:EbsA family protein [Fructobacillus tropaeoli]|uniref:Pore-forming protein n=1 Tax=Fructobacillus tropaeoli TaxID=709323 RepID=A0ABN9YJT5_9LACO|nr:EbsA family protein [Fructobacillus tropaeoli]GIC69960.1 EbsA family protein [Fructobacillus tropaeoli]CAK1226675.1 hypothetical protein R53137_KAKDMLNK_00152 [Fructobacillus tropaeoli]
MRVIRGFYQPKADWSNIAWIMWLSVLIISPIWASELFYNINWWWATYTIIMVLIGLWTFFGRKIMLENQTLTIKSAWLMKQQVIDLNDSAVNWFFDQKALIVVIGGRPRAYHLSKKMAQALKGMA